AEPPRGRIDDSPQTRAWEAASRVVSALPAFGPRVLPPLLKALESRGAHTRGYAADALLEIAQLGGLPETAVDRLEKCLEDEDKEVRRTAATAMSWVRPSSTKAVAVLARDREDRLSIDNTTLLAALERMCP